VYLGRNNDVLSDRRRTKEQTLKQHHLLNQKAGCVNLKPMSLILQRHITAGQPRLHSLIRIKQSSPIVRKRC
jgi:hypothetical protein